MLTPEVNSGRMYSGPGSGPMLAVAAAWNGLAAELESAANSYRSVISGLVGGSWLGPASVSMAAAATPYAAWMSTTAAQAAQTAVQAQATAAAYEAAFAATVPPPVIAANRAQLMTLIATNLFGQNTAAIAATESAYAEMWAQDTAAMYGYAGSAATVTSGLPTFSPAPQTTTGAPAATITQPVASQLTSTVVQALTPAASAAPAAAASPLSTLSDLAGLTTFLPTIATASLEPVDFTADFTDFGLDEEDFDLEEQLAGAGYALVPVTPPGPAQSMMPGLTTPFSPAEVPAVTAGMSRAPSVGGLSVPPAWAAAAPAIRPLALELPAASLGAAPAVWAGSSGTLLSEIGLAGLAGRAIGRTAVGGRPAPDKPGDAARYRAQIAATFGGHAAGASKGNRSDSDPAEGELLEQVATRYPAVFALLGALCSPKEGSTEAGLAKLEHEIRALANRFTPGP